MSIGCGPAYDADCAVADVLTHFVQEEGRLNQMVTRQIDNTDPLLRLGNQTKRPFPAGMGDTITDTILLQTIPGSDSGKNWDNVGRATCDESPCCTEPELIRYGYTQFTGCLAQKSYRTQDFCVIDLTFKHKRDQQMRNLTDMLPTWTMHVQKFWYRSSYRECTSSMVLNENAGNPITMGEYETAVQPTSALTPAHLDEIYIRLMDKGANLNPFTVSGGVPYHVCLIGHEEYRYLSNLAKEEDNALGMQSPTIGVDAFGPMRTIRNFTFIPVQYPTRLKWTGTAYAEVDSHVEVKTKDGWESKINPEYRDPNVAKYTEAVFWNSEAAHWLIPPDFTDVGMAGFGPQDFSGRFRLINLKTPCDPTGKNAYFLAEYMNGMIPRHPERAITVLALAVHVRGLDRVPLTPSTPSIPSETAIPVHGAAVIPNAVGQLSFTTPNTNTVPVCGAEQILYLRTQKGLLAQVDQIVYNGAADTCTTALIVKLVDTPAAVVRKCDPWAELVCLDRQYPTSATAETDCDICPPEDTTDTAAPTVVVSGPTAGTNGVGIPITVAFSEEVTGFVVGDVTVGGSGGSKSAFVDAGGGVFTLTVTPSAAGTLTISVGAAVAADAAGNNNAASNTLKITVSA